MFVTDASFDRNPDIGYFFTRVEIDEHYTYEIAVGVSPEGDILILIGKPGDTRTYEYSLADPESIEKAQSKLLEYLPRRQ
jgi:hypothetical protein